MTLLLVAHAVVALASSSTNSNMSTSSIRRVLVTGAGGKTGRIVLQKLLEIPDQFVPTGVVRTAASQQSLMKELGIPAERLCVADICDASAIEKAVSQTSADALIICTSATPAPTGEMTAEGRPVFGFPNGQPEEVDWIGQKNQFDAMLKYGNKQAHVVICSSMGGTDPENGLNKIGRQEDGSGGNILLWKRKAEKYLMDSGLTYTIVHPGGLLDEAGGKRELVVGVDDEQVETDSRSIPRADVAQILIASLMYESYKNRSFDVRSKPEGEGTVTTDFDHLPSKLKGRNCDYSLGKIA